MASLQAAGPDALKRCLLSRKTQQRRNGTNATSHSASSDEAATDEAKPHAKTGSAENKPASWRRGTRTGACGGKIPAAACSRKIASN